MATAGKPIKCTAAVMRKANEPFSLETVEVDVPKKNEVRVRMKSTGVCHSDLHFVEGLTDTMFPGVLGHEGAGVIESVGEGVTSVKPGDVVVCVFEAYCGECKFCKSPQTNVCMKQSREHLQFDGTSRIKSSRGESLKQMGSLGTFSEYIVTSEANVTKVNQAANPNVLCLAGCCIPTGYGAVMKAGRPPRGSTCAVWGLGGVGMCVLMGCRDSGASKVIGIDLNPAKFEFAKQFGATHFVNPKEVKSVPEKLAEMTDGGVDFCFVSVGIAAAMEQAFNSSHPHWGKTVVIGLGNEGETMRAGIWELLYGRQLVGTYYGSYKAKLEIPGLVDKVVSGQIQLEKLITHKLPLRKISDGFRMLKTGESLRAIVDFDLK